MRGTDQMETAFPQKIRDLLKNEQQAVVFDHLVARAQDKLLDKTFRTKVLNAELEEVCVAVAEAMGKASPLPRESISFSRPTNIYVASEIYETGGHGRVLEQMIAARPAERHIVLFTGLLSRMREYSIRRISAVGGFPIFADTQAPMYDRYIWLREKLAAYAAQRLVFFHHPQDALAAVAAYEMAPRYGKRLYIYRHTDTAPVLSAGLKEATHITFRTEQDALLKKHTPEVRSLTLPLLYDPRRVTPPIAPDILAHIEQPAKERAFMTSGTLTTATCGNEQKFTMEGPLAFGTVIAKVLQSTRGVHVHIGPSPQAFRDAALAALDDKKIDAHRLIFVGAVASVAQTLVAYNVDCLLNSFPTGGGLTSIEAAYAGVPVMAYKVDKGSAEDVYMAGTSHVPQGTPLWSTTTELLKELQSISAEKVLQKASKAGRRWYKRYFTPERFASRLNAIYRANELRLTRTSLLERDRVIGQAATQKRGIWRKTSEEQPPSELFDRAYYLAQNKDVAGSKMDPASHFRKFGDTEKRSPHLLFDGAYYVGNLPDTERKLAAKSPLGHYLARGEAMGYQPHPLFNPVFYKRQIGDRKVSDSLLETYLKTDQDAPVSPHCLFDLSYYTRQLKDQSHTQPMVSHFLTFGAGRGLDPHPLVRIKRFGDADAANSFLAYLSQPAPYTGEAAPHPLFAPDIFAAGNPGFFAPAAPNLLWAYIIEGNVEGRDPHPLISTQYLQRTGAVETTSASVCLRQIAQNRVAWDTHPLVDFAYIQKQAPWIATQDQHPLAYFMEHCVTQNIDPHPYFAVQYYLFKNHDVAQAGVNPLLHYLSSGQFEGRWPHPFFDGPYYYHTHMAAQSEGRQPLVHYTEQGAGQFLSTQKTDPVQVEMNRKLSSRLFKLGDMDGAVQMYRESLHPATAVEHPSLSCEIVPYEGGVSAWAQGSETTDFTRIFSHKRVLLERPRVLSPVHIAPKIGGYTAPEVATGVFEYVTLIGGNDGFITETGGWCDDGLVDFADSKASLKDNGAVVEFDGENLLMRSHRTLKTFAAGIHASGTYSRNYFHFLIETLPRIIAAAQIAPKGTPVLADSDMPTQHLQALRAALPDNPVRQVRRNASYAVRKLSVASMGNQIRDVFSKEDAPVDAVRYHPEVLAMLREVGHGVASDSKSRKILLRRNSGVRKLLNQNQIEELLVRRGFEVVECERLSFSEQVSLFAAADVIVGQSGAQLANIVFARPGTKVYALYSNAPGTNYYLWSAMGQHLGLDVVNVVGWRLAGSATGDIRTVHEDFTLPISMLEPFFEVDDAENPDDKPAKNDTGADKDETLEELHAALDTLYGANAKADMLTGCWGLLGEKTPDGFEDVLNKARHTALLALNATSKTKANTLEEEDLAPVLAKPFFTDYGRNIRSGFAALAPEDSTEQALGAAAVEQLSILSKGASKKKIAAMDLHRMLGTAMLTTQAYQAPIARSIEDWPDGLRACYLNWLMSPPFCYREGEDAKYVAFVHRLLIWLSEKLTANDEPKTQSAISDMATHIDLGTLLMVDQPLRDVAQARNTILERLAVTGGAPRKDIRPDDESGGRKRIGILCRTFDKGPDSEAVISFFKTFDKKRYEIFAYSVGFQDRVVKSDPKFDRLFDRTIEHRRILSNNPRDIRAEILSDDLDVFLYANATTYGIQSLDVALYSRVAPVQMVLNCHVPASLGYPSFDYYVTGKSDDPSVEPDQADYAETLLRLPGPVINYQNSLLKEDPPLFDRSALGLKDTDVVLLNAGSLSKLRHECLHTMLRAVKGIPNGVLVLAPYNPGWVARSQAFAFNRQLIDTAAEVGVSMDKIRVMGELSVAEAETVLQLCDIYLNPFPHGGATMTHLALIYGKPPVTMRRRSTRSIDQFLINSLGCDSLLVNTTDAYVACVAGLASDPEARLSLSERLKTDAAKPVFVDNPDYSDEMLAIVDEIVAKHTSKTKDS